MAEKKQFRAIKGVRDILPPESALWNRVEQTAREVFATYGYGEIRLPIFEQAELFARSVGAETDIVSKEMYGVWNPSLGPLEVLKREVQSLRIKDTGDNDRLTADVRNFFEALHAFTAELSLAFEQGMIPGTPENTSLVKVLHDLERTTDCEFHSSAGVAAGFEQWSGWIDKAQVAAKELRLQEDLRLRPEATASVVRAYIEHGMHTWPGDVKLYYIGPMFRRERPQKGRYRQFYQIGAEVLGQSDAPAIDAEVIEMLMAFFDRAGLKGATLYLNSIGCKECRTAYLKLLRSELGKVKDQLGADSQRRIETNPLRVLDSKLPEEQNIIENLPRITDHLCAACREHFDALKRELALRSIRYEENWRLVRGLDYYMRTTFEITAPGLGAQSAVCGGGRYDGLVELLGGPPTKGIGFAIGTDRVILALQHTGVDTPAAVDVLLAWMDLNSYDHARIMAKSLRDAGLSVQMPTKPMQPREGLGLARRLGIPIGVVIGADELSALAYTVRFLSEGKQVTVSQSDFSQITRVLLLRVPLEKALVQVARLHGVEYQDISPAELNARLTQNGHIPGQVKVLIERALEIINKVGHEARITDDELAEAVGKSLFALKELSREYGDRIFTGAEKVSRA